MRRLLVSVPLLVGCTSANVLHVDATPRPAVAVGAVAVLLDEPAAAYRSIALVEVAGSMGASLDRMGRRLIAEAAKLGGDAVLLTHRTGQSGSTLVPIGHTFVSLDTDDSRLVGKVIVYTPATTASADSSTIRGRRQ